MNTSKFQIQKYLDRLVPVEGKLNYYHCPCCNDKNFYVDPKTFKWNPFGCDCDRKEIIELLNPRSEWLRENSLSSTLPYGITRLDRPNNSESPDMKQVTNVNFSIPITIANIKSIEGKIDSTYDALLNETRYFYSEKQAIVRSYSRLPVNGESQKTIRPQYLNSNGDWRLGKGDQKWGLYQFSLLTHNVAGKWLIVVEGEKCVEFLLERNILATTPQSNEYTKECLVPLLGVLKNKGLLGIVILPDNDKPGMQKARKLEVICDHIGLANVTVPYTAFEANLPDGADIVDLMTETISQESSSIIMSDFITRLENQIHSALRAKYMKEEMIATHSKESSTESISVKGKATRLTQQIASNILVEAWQGKYKYHIEQSVWREWTGSHWATVHNDQIDKDIINFLEARNLSYSTVSFIESTRKLLGKKLGNTKWTSASRARYVNFSNGTLDLDTLSLNPHNPNQNFTSVLPYPYSVINNISTDIFSTLKSNTPIFFETFFAAMGNDEQKLMKLLSVIKGILTYHFSKLQMFPYLLGVPASGKGTFIRLCEKMVGRENHQSSRISKLNDDYHVATVIDKQLVVCSDEDSQRGPYANFKSMTGGDSVSYRAIYKEPSCSVFEGTILAVANGEVFRGNITGIERRICLVEFKHSISTEKRDPNLDKKLESEIPFLLPIVLGIPQTVITDYLKGIGNGKIAALEAGSWNNRVTADSVAAWLEDNIIFDSRCSEYIGVASGNTTYLYPNYLAHCKDMGMQACNFHNFASKVLEHSNSLGFSIEKARTKIGMKLNGLRLRTDADKDLTISEKILSEEKLETKPTSSTSSLLDKDSRPSPKPSPNLHYEDSNLHPKSDSQAKGVDGVDIHLWGVGCGEDSKPLPDKDGVDGEGLNPKTSKPKIHTDKNGKKLEVGQKVRFTFGIKEKETKGIIEEIRDSGLLAIKLPDFPDLQYQPKDNVEILPIAYS